MRTREETDFETIRVNAPVDDPDIPIWTEVMSAAPDPADPDQAVLLNVPFFIDGLNFGDIVRLGPADESGVRPIIEIVLASGHVHVLAATEDGEALELVAQLERMFPAYALKVERGSDTILAISIHPDLNADDVVEVIEDWLALDAEDDEEGLAVGAISRTDLGPLVWPVSPER